MPEFSPVRSIIMLILSIIGMVFTVGLASGML
jgi:LPS O-antigen subunit length determinant protein (WzzB/FepE family)